MIWVHQHQSKSGQKHNTYYTDIQDNSAKQTKDTASSSFVGVTYPTIELRPLSIHVSTENWPRHSGVIPQNWETSPAYLTRELNMLPVCKTKQRRKMHRQRLTKLRKTKPLIQSQCHSLSQSSNSQVRQNTKDTQDTQTNKCPSPLRQTKPFQKYRQPTGRIVPPIQESFCILTRTQTGIS